MTPSDLPIQDSLIHDTQALAAELGIPWDHLITLALNDFMRRHHEREHLIERINAAYTGTPDEKERELLQRMRSSHRKIVEGEW